MVSFSPTGTESGSRSSQPDAAPKKSSASSSNSMKGSAFSGLRSKGNKYLKQAIRTHVRNRSTIKLVRLNELMVSNSFVSFRPLPDSYFPSDIVKRREREERMAKLAEKKRGKKRNSKWGMGNALSHEETNGATASALNEEQQTAIPTSLSRMLANVDETGMFVRKTDGLASVSSRLASKYKYAFGCNLYFPFGSRFVSDPKLISSGTDSNDRSTQKQNMRLLANDQQFNAAMEAWQLKIYEDHKIIVKNLFEAAFKKINRAYDVEHASQACLEICELASNAHNLKFMDPAILTKLLTFLRPPCNAVAMNLTRVFWTLASHDEFVQVLLEMPTVPTLVNFYHKGLPEGELTTAEEATTQMNIVGVFTRIVFTPHHNLVHHQLHLIANVLSETSTRDQKLALADIEGKYRQKHDVDMDFTPREAHTNQYAGDGLCYLLTHHKKLRSILKDPIITSRIAVNLQSSKTELIRCAAVTCSMIIRDPEVRGIVDKDAALEAFDALCKVAAWCVETLELMVYDKEGADQTNTNNKMYGYSTKNTSFSSVVPKLLETVVVSMWGFCVIIREDLNLEKRATDALSRRRQQRLKRHELHGIISIEEEMDIIVRRRRESAAEESELNQEREKASHIDIQDDAWIDICKKLTVLDDARVSAEVGVSAAGMMSYMLGNPGSAFRNNVLSHVLYLLEPTTPLKIRANASMALSRLCAAEFNSIDYVEYKNHPDPKSLPKFNKKWSKFCKLMFRRNALDALFHCAMHNSHRHDMSIAHRHHDDALFSGKLREGAASSLLYLCAEYRGEVGKIQLTSLVHLLACDSCVRVQLYAATAIWCCARNLSNRKLIGKLDGASRLIQVLTNIHDGTTKKRNMKNKNDAWSPKIQRNLKTWCGLALWLLCCEPENAVFVAEKKYAISLLIREIRNHSDSLVKLDPRMIKKQVFSDESARDESAFAQTLIGTLRRVVATSEGKAVVTRDNLGYTLIDTLFGILNFSPNTELLRETCGLLFYLQESPDNLEFIQLVTNSSTGVEDLFLKLLKSRGEGAALLHLESTHALAGLCCKNGSKMYIGRSPNSINQIFENFCLYNEKLEEILRQMSDDGVQRITYFKYHHRNDESKRDVEWQESYANVRICLKLLLNLSTDKEFLLIITQLFTNFLVTFAFENEHEFDLEIAKQYEFEQTRARAAGADPPSPPFHDRAYFDDELAILSCKILSNLGKSVDGRISLRLYKAQLKLVRSRSSSPQKSHCSNSLSQPSVTSQYKNEEIDKKADMHKYLKKSLCPAWFNHYFVSNMLKKKNMPISQNPHTGQDSIVDEDNAFSYCESRQENGSVAEILSIDNDDASISTYEGEGGGGADMTTVSAKATGKAYDNASRIALDPIDDKSSAAESIELPSIVAGSQDESVLEEGEAFHEQRRISANVVSSMQNLMFKSAKSNIMDGSVRPSTAPSPYAHLQTTNFSDGSSFNSKQIAIGAVHTVDIPKQANPWEPPIIMQVMEKGKDEKKSSVTMNETVVLDPSRKYSRVTFKTAIDQFGRFKQHNHVKSDVPVTLWRWQHVPGSVVSADSHKFLDSLDGKSYIYYDCPTGSVASGTFFVPLFPTEHPGAYPNPPTPSSLLHITGASIPSPCESLKPTAKTIVPPYVKGDDNRCPSLGKHMIPLCKEACIFAHGHQGCPGKSCQMMGHLSTRDFPFYVREMAGGDVASLEESVEFDLNGTIFEPRKHECESKDFYNSRKIRRKEMEYDWKRGTETKRFDKFLKIFDSGLKKKKKTMEDVKAEIKAVMKKNCVLFQQSYQYYAMKASGMSGYGTGSTCVHENSYHKFLKDLQDHGAREDDRQFQELVRIFLTVNLEEDREAAKNEKFNFSSCLMKGEWVETLIRVSVALYMQDEKDGTATDAEAEAEVEAEADDKGKDDNDEYVDLTTVKGCVMKLFEKMDENLPPEATVDDDEYRKERLYTQEVTNVLEKYKKLLGGVFVVYPVSDHKMRTKKPDLNIEYFGLDDFERLLSDSGMYTHGINRLDAKSAFLQARMVVSDEIGRRDKEVTITLVDFYEALARLADKFSTDQMKILNNMYEGETSENLDKFLKIMFQGLAIAWNGELRCVCHGHAWDQKKFASLKAFVPVDSEHISAMKSKRSMGSTEPYNSVK